VSQRRGARAVNADRLLEGRADRLDEVLRDARRRPGESVWSVSLHTQLAHGSDPATSGDVVDAAIAAAAAARAAAAAAVSPAAADRLGDRAREADAVYRASVGDVVVVVVVEVEAACLLYWDFDYAYAVGKPSPEARSSAYDAWSAACRARCLAEPLAALDDYGAAIVDAAPALREVFAARRTGGPGAHPDAAP